MTAKIAKYITENDNQLKKLVLRAQQLYRIEQLLLSKLSEPLRSHLRLANISGDTAVVLTDSPTWTNQARFMAPDILAILGQIPQTRGVKEVKFRTGSPADFTQAKPRTTVERKQHPSYQAQRQRLRSALQIPPNRNRREP